MTKTITLLEKSTFLVGVFLIALAMMIISLPFTAHADTLNRQLELGMRGTDVSALQTFLASDPAIYPQGLVTGYFGFLTKSAVSNFQSRNGISSVGRVGPATLPVLNLQMAQGMANNNSNILSAPMISNVSTNSSRNGAVVSWNTNELAKGLVYYSTSPLTTYENTNSVNVSGDTAMTDTDLKTSQSVSINNLQANTTYYYLIYTTDRTGNVSVTWPSTFQTTN